MILTVVRVGRRPSSTVTVAHLNSDERFSVVRTTAASPKRPATPSRSNDQRNGSTLPNRPTPSENTTRATTPPARHDDANTNAATTVTHRQDHPSTSTPPGSQPPNSRATNEGCPQGSIRPGAKIVQALIKEKGKQPLHNNKGCASYQAQYIEQRVCLRAAQKGNNNNVG